MSERIYVFLVVAFFFLFVSTRPAHAYLDPGNGSYLLQIILGVVFGGAVTVGVFFERIRKFIGRSKNKKDED